MSGSFRRVGDTSFEVGEAAVLEAQVGPGCLEAFVEGPVVGGELADALFEGGVLSGDPLDGFLGPFGLKVADLAQEFADAGSLVEDLGVGGFEGALGVERPLPPGRLSLVVQISQCLAAALVGVRDGCGDRAARLGVFVEERPRDAGPTTHGGDGDRELFPA